MKVWQILYLLTMKYLPNVNKMSGRILLTELSNTIKNFYFTKDTPPPDGINVPEDQIVPSVDGSSYGWHAVIEYITDTGVSQKIHSMKIRFNLDDAGLFDSSSARYVFD